MIEGSCTGSPTVTRRAANEEDMLKLIKHFALEEDGAVTVDWVILCAGVISLALAAVGVITDGVDDASSDVEGKLKSQLISTSFNSGDNV